MNNIFSQIVIKTQFRITLKKTKQTKKKRTHTKNPNKEVYSEGLTEDLT